MKRNPLRKFTITMAQTGIALFATLQQAGAVEFEPLGKALTTLLKTTKAFPKKAKVGNKDAEAFYAKGSGGTPAAVAFDEKGIYEPNCTHTWAIGIDPKSGKVTQVRVIEMSCNHAFPTNKPNFLDQFKGKGPADVAKLDGQIDTIAKATGSSKLTTDAVKHAIVAYQKMKGHFN
jgi:hypothetical protein